jgi:hypothetical protein
MGLDAEELALPLLSSAAQLRGADASGLRLVAASIGEQFAAGLRAQLEHYRGKHPEETPFGTATMGALVGNAVARFSGAPASTSGGAPSSKTGDSPTP